MTNKPKIGVCKRIRIFGYEILCPSVKGESMRCHIQCHDDAIFHGIFELKILLFHKIEISKNGIYGENWDLGN